MAPGKRKRTDRSSIDSGDQRPSPHRPGNTVLGQHDRNQDMRDGGNRRSSRGGHGGQGGQNGQAQGRGGRRNITQNHTQDRNDNHNRHTVSGRVTPTAGPMSPPAPRPSSATQTPTPTVDLPSPIVKPDPLPFDYVFLTDDRVSNWETIGRQAVVSAGSQARLDEDHTDMCTVFQELVRATFDVRIDATEAGNCVKEILGLNTAAADDNSSESESQTLFLDMFSMVVDAEPGANDAKTFPKVLRTFATATGVSPITMRHKLDSTLVQNLGLTRETFIRVGIRQATHLLYRQANYNLLREETEGYSKLVAELFTTSESEPPSAQVVAETFEKVKGLIGTFDLDVGRVLDITMDVFAAVLIKHFRFFIKLLRVSSWWPRNGETDSAAAARCNGLPKWALPGSANWFTSEEEEEKLLQQRVGRDIKFWERVREVGLDAFFELGGREVVDVETKKRLLGVKADGDAELDADRQWIESTGTFPPSGNRIAAQLLGFKLRFYSSGARDKEDVLPPNLIYLTALLIKIGFISLRDLYPHLWPFDENMEKVKELRMKELEEKERANRPGGGTNALMMAGALVDDTLPNGGRTRDTAPSKVDSIVKPVEAEDSEELDEPADQKILLLTCLLTIGAIPESLFILGRFPWLPEAYPDLLDLIHRILNHSIKDVYNMSRPTANQDFQCPTKEIVDPDQSGVPKGHVRLSPNPPKKLLRWPYPDKHDTHESSSYRFYWDEWADSVPVCQTVDDVFTLCGTLLNYSGVNIGKDASLLSKLARIGVKSLATDSSKANLDRWQDLLKRLLVPALSLTKANTSVANEIYDMLRFYPVSIRYLIYAEWFEGQISRLPAIKAAFARTKLETLGIMKRISMTNLTAMAKSLAKTAYASPGVVFAVALSQIEAYTNLTEVVVECAKYFTDLGYDVLVWSLLSSLGGKDRNRNNAEFALLPSRWLLALSRFSGKVFKRYSIMNLSPIVQYVNDQLYRGNSTDLVILKELIAQMAGVVPDTDFTDAQLSAMTGGELLRKQTLINLQDRRYESTKTAKRLMRALTETKLAGQLLLSIAQHRQAAIYRVTDEDAHIKLLATMIDDSQLILFQYLDLLRSNLSVEDFDNHVPDISNLLVDFGLATPLAFLIGRASISHRLEKAIKEESVNGAAGSPTALAEAAAIIDADGDVGMVSDSATSDRLMDDSQSSIIQPEGTKDDVQMDEAQDASVIAIERSDTSTLVNTYDAVLHPIIETMQTLLTEQCWNAITPQFYVVFWVSTLRDLVFPKLSYETEVRRLDQATTSLERDRSDMSQPAINRRADAKLSLQQTNTTLKLEWEADLRAHVQRRKHIADRKGGFFLPSIKPDMVSDAILEKCIIPRALLSPIDADYCFKMIKFLHENGTPHFRTLSLYGRLFKTNRLRSVIFTCTVREAENFGRLLHSIFADLARWHGDASLYEQEAWGLRKNLPGFAKALETDGTPKGLFEHDGKGMSSFKSQLFMWHKAMNSALRDCLDGTEWMHIRNAITILKCLVGVFPAVDFMGKGFIKQLETVAKREKDVREDLSLTGNAVLVQLKKRSSKWVMVQAFSSNMVPPNIPPTKSATPPTSTPKSSLKPTAPEFKPQSRSSSLGVSTPKPTTNDVEDGEVDDAKAPPSIAKLEAPTIEAPNTKAASPAPATIEPQKSEVLLKREQHLRERDAKNAMANNTGRLDLPRNTSASSTDRNSHALPIRPDAPFPSHQMLDRDRHPSSSRYGDRRDGRDARLPDSTRLDRPGDKSRDFARGDRRDPEPSRDFSRGLDRPRTRPDRPEPPPRWTPDSARENQERASNGGRMSDTSGRLSREVMPPPRPSGPSDRKELLNDRVSSLNPDRPELINAEGTSINPARAALITGASTPPRTDSPHRFRDDTRNARDRTSSRAQSPRRHGSEREHGDTRREERSSRSDEIIPPPAGPRNDRPVERNNERGPIDRSRDNSGFQSNLTPRPMDPDHGRLNSNRQQMDPNFGRLNSSPTADAPSGPRDRNDRGQRGGRMSNGPQRRDSRLVADLPRPPTPEMVVPTGPSSNRQPRHSASGQFDAPAQTPNVVLPTPVGISPAHQGSRNFGSSSQLPLPPPIQQPSIAPAGVHPDRLKSFMADSNPGLPPPLPSTNLPRQPIPSVVTAIAPSGPKGSLSSPSSASANGMTPPTGPASAVERARGGRRQLAGINTTLQQAGGGMNVRGRSSRISSAVQAENSISQPTTPTVPPPPPPPPGPPPNNRDTLNQFRADLITGGGAEEDRDRDRNGRRSGRHSRRTSRSPHASDRTRDPSKRGLDEERSGREHRDRREGGRSEPSDRERHPSREQSKDLMATGRDRERDSRRDGHGRDGVREVHEAGWNGERGDRGAERGGRSRDMRGGEGRGGEERRDSRNFRGEDGGRKRRPEEGGMDRGHEKRPRR